jgi:hypothetical protein
MTEENKTQAPATEAPKSEAPAQGAPDLTVQDLQALKAIIDVASQRGAYKPNEMEVVGRTYNRLDIFLQAITPKQEAPAEGTAPAQPTAPAQSAEAPKE